MVKIHTDDGIVGIGETDISPWATKAYIESPATHSMGLGLKNILVGEDPTQTEPLWDKMYVSTCMSGRRGLGICAIGALDTALWDIRGKALGKPACELLGGPKRSRIRPYASLSPTGNTLNECAVNLLDKLVKAKNYGFEAAKLEIIIDGSYSQVDLQDNDSHILKVVASCREAVGPNMTLMLDVGYAWNDWRKALRIIQQLEPYDIYFVETPLTLDDLEGYAALANKSPIRIAAGEWLQTRFEFKELIDRGHVDVVQPDVGRVGGLTEAKRVVELSAERGRLVVPHCWKTGIGIAASAHLAFASPKLPFIEFLPAEFSDSAIRRELVKDELQMDEGYISLPKKPGLGIDLNEAAINKYRVA